MSFGGIVIGSGQFYTSNPCAEIILEPEPLKKTCVRPSYDGAEFTVPTCMACGCPDLIDDDPEVWECMSCGHKHFSAVLSKPVDAENWRPKEQYGIIDWLLSHDSHVTEQPCEGCIRSWS